MEQSSVTDREELIDPERQSQTAVKDVTCDFVPQTIEDFGVDYDGPFPDEQLHSVNVPETVCPLPSAAVAGFFAESDTVNIDDAALEYTTKRSWLISYLSSVTP